MITFYNVSKKYKNKEILRNISFSINKGESIAIVGKSKEKKSTILNIIGLLDDFDSGNYTLVNRDIGSISNRRKNRLFRKHIGYLFQDFSLIDDETVFYNLSLALLDKKTKKEKLIEIRTVLNLMNLSGKEDTMVNKLSKLDQQCLVIARLFLKDSSIILIHESTELFNNENKQIILDLLTILNKRGKTIIITTQDEDVVKWCGGIIEL